MEAVKHTYLMIDQSDLRQILREEIKELMEEMKSKPSDDLYTKKQAMEILGKGTTFFHRLQKYGYLQPVMIGSRVNYSKQEVDSLIGKKIHLPQ